MCKAAIVAIWSHKRIVVTKRKRNDAKRKEMIIETPLAVEIQKINRKRKKCHLVKKMIDIKYKLKEWGTGLK